jgi:hypothetical protein
MGLDLFDFEKGFQDLCARFGKKESKGLCEIYYRRLRKIPSKVFVDIMESVIDNYKTFPSPQDIKNAWHDWLDNHPESKVQKYIVPCQYCDGKGWLEYIATESGHAFYHKLKGLTQCRYKRIARCGHCVNWEAQEIPRSFQRWTVDDIRRSGFEMAE